MQSVLPNYDAASTTTREKFFARDRATREKLGLGAKPCKLNEIADFYLFLFKPNLAFGSFFRYLTNLKTASDISFSFLRPFNVSTG